MISLILFKSNFIYDTFVQFIFKAYTVNLPCHKRDQIVIQDKYLGGILESIKWYTIYFDMTQCSPWVCMIWWCNGYSLESEVLSLFTGGWKESCLCDGSEGRGEEEGLEQDSDNEGIVNFRVLSHHCIYLVLYNLITMGCCRNLWF